MGEIVGVAGLTAAEARACVGGGLVQASLSGFWTPPPAGEGPNLPLPPVKIIWY